jgi:hypothetical protein
MTDSSPKFTAMKRTPLAAISILIFLIFAVPASSQSGGVSADKCAMEGTVVDAVSGQPLRAAQVRLRGLPGANPGAIVSQALTTVTDASGKFAFAGLAAGRYFLLASHDGYVNDGVNPGSRGDLLTVGPGACATDVVLRLLPGGVVAGHVTNESAKPLRGVAVQAMRSEYSHGRRELRDAGHTATNEAGEYRIAGLPAGRYYIRAQVPGSLAPKAGSDRAYVPQFYPAATAHAHAVALPLHAGGELAGIDLNFVPVHTVRIRGRVVDARTSLPVKEAEITLLSDEGETTFAEGKDFSVGGQASFEFAGVPAGSYVVVAQEAGDTLHGKTMWGRTSVEVGDKDLDHVEIAVGPGADVSGHIRVESKASVELKGIMGMLESQEPSALASLMPDFDNASVQSDGSFIFREVPEGNYRINFSPLPSGFYLKSGSSEDALQATISVGRGHASAAPELILSAGAGQVDGTVMNGDQAFPSALVVLVPDGRRRDQPSNYRQSVAGTQGRFVMRNVAPGDYTIFAWEHVERGAYMDPDFLGEYEDRGKAVHVEEGGHASAQIDLIPASETGP